MQAQLTQHAYSILMVKFFGLYILQLAIAALFYLAETTWLPISVAFSIFLITSFITTFLAVQQSKIAKESNQNKQQVVQLKEQLEETQENLEAIVQERTLELHIALQELEEANKTLEEQNTLDELTGIYNRRYYDKRITAELRRSRRNLSPLSLLVIDIDHFKQVNDNYGHAIGDECLKAVSQQLTKYASRSGDRVCRYGGEEFCIILADTDQSGALVIADKIREAVENTPVNLADKKIELTVSIGLSVYQQGNLLDSKTLFEHADKALYQAKQQGRNRIKVA